MLLNIKCNAASRLHVPIVTLSQYHVQDIAQVHQNAVRINAEPQTQFIIQSLLGLYTDNSTLSGPLQPRKLPAISPRAPRHQAHCGLPCTSTTNCTVRSKNTRRNSSVPGLSRVLQQLNRDVRIIWAFASEKQTRNIAIARLIVRLSGVRFITACSSSHVVIACNNLMAVLLACVRVVLLFKVADYDSLLRNLLPTWSE